MNFDQKIAQAVRQAVKDAFDLDAEENVLTIDTPKDRCPRRRASPWQSPAF